MYIYYGTLNYFEYAVDEPFIIVIPNDFVPNDPICGYWQWTKDPKSGQGNRDSYQQSVIKASLMQFPQNILDISFVFGDYIFDATVVDQRSFHVTMSNTTRDQVSHINYLELSYDEKTKITSPRIYTAKFDWDEQGQEILTAVVPGGFVTSGQPVCAYFQQTKEIDGENRKTSNSTVTEFTGGGDGENEEVDASFTSYDGRTWVIKTADNPLRITGMQVPQGDSKTVPLVRNGPGSETARKALIVRYDVGTDDGIFRMRDLVHMLGFYETSVEMLYYNLEPRGGPRTCSSGQQAPTATRFKEKFAELLRNVQPGDVRFLYIDAHSSPRAEPGVDDGWELARDENGRRDEIVYGDWITRCINEASSETPNLVRGVNLTILTPLGPGGCISDNTPGIIFAGCHEVQTSVKALNDMDPWTVAIAEVIERHKESCRPIPTYAQLYTSARKFITDWIRSGELPTDHYLGPSPDGANPDGSSSHQDPQLVFCEDHINVDTERFLCPLAREGWNNVGLTKRFPKDEL